MITLERPLVFLDLETTGTDVNNDRIVDIALLRREPNGVETLFASLVDPELPIPAAATAVHHISDEMVKGQPTFKDLAPKVVDFIDGCDLGGFNVLKFDIPLLAAELKRAGRGLDPLAHRVVDAFAIFQKMEPRSLGAAYKFYCGKAIDGAHRAEADTRAAMEVFWGQLERYPELPRDMGKLAVWCKGDNLDSQGKFVWRNGQVALNFGKHRNTPLEEIAKRDPSYLKWFMGTEQATDEQKQICEEALKGRFPTKA